MVTCVNAVVTVPGRSASPTSTVSTGRRSWQHRSTSSMSELTPEDRQVAVLASCTPYIVESVAWRLTTCSLLPGLPSVPAELHDSLQTFSSVTPAVSTITRSGGAISLQVVRGDCVRLSIFWDGFKGFNDVTSLNIDSESFSESIACFRPGLLCIQTQYK